MPSTHVSVLIAGGGPFGLTLAIELGRRGIAYFTRFARYELARFRLPAAREARRLIGTLSGSWSAAELPHRCNQKFIEPVLRRHAEAQTSAATDRAAVVRGLIGARYTGETGVARDFVGGRMYAVYA
ncbi:MAG: hypothetical protein ACT4P4_23925, partial [Betaproteobacteria bacterium]